MNNWKKRFVVIWTGQLFSILSSSIAQFAIIIWISLETGSAGVLATATIAGLLPQIVIGPFAGVVVDRYSRKWTMIGADGFVALCSGVMALLFYLDMMDLWVIYLMLVLRSVGSAFHSPAMKSSVPMLAPESELTRIAGVNQMIQSVSSICGPALGAVLIVWFDMGTVMLIDVFGALVACTALCFVEIPMPAKSGVESAKNVLREIGGGVEIILKNRGLSRIMLAEILITFFLMPVIAMLPLMTLKHFGKTAVEVGVTEVCFGVGTLMGGLFLTWWNPKVRRVVLILGSYVVFGSLFLGCGLLGKGAFVVYVVLTFFQGFIAPFYSGPFTALLQTQIDKEFQGRVFSVFDSICLLPSIIGLMAVGVLADNFGVPVIFLVGGVATLLTAAWAMSKADVRNLEK